MPKHTAGFVYVLSNPAMPGLIKVGRTRQLTESRAKKLQTTGVPVPFTVEFRALTSKPEAVEAVAHKLLAASRVSLSREFFQISATVAIDAVRTALVDAAGLNAWADDEEYEIDDRIALTLRANDLFAVFELPHVMAPTMDLVDLWQAHSDGDLLELMGTNDPGHTAGFSDADPGGDDDPVPFLVPTKKVANATLFGRERLSAGTRLAWIRPTADGHACQIATFQMLSHCQVTARTWDPQVDSNGWPILLNFVTTELERPGIIRTLKAVRRMALPRSWAPRNPDPTSDWALPAQQSQPPEYWMHQLQNPGIRRKSP
ncbi:GIY-YIG nuclease family protein [Kribbella solani]|uniref:GIY-YIG nuclease family protein n=1 Tax=Kribbella solani TaxID=236067 RepID=UPI0029B5F81B|nr:GIY-YIG nuclease family protein [Kribbella solani]MDX2970036.1 GIY-YIG nuclease family protein [Kribbella solani]